jgi:hypothetical protein
MANKRMLKKQINAMIIDVIDECIYIQEVNDDKAEAAEGLIEEVISTYNELLSRMNSGKTKSDFKAIVADFDQKSDELLDKLNGLNH